MKQWVKVSTITYFPQKVHAISGASEEKNDIGEISQRD